MGVAAVLLVFAVAACVPPPEIHSVDLSAIRIGAERGAIERAVGVESQSEASEGRVVAIYRYGPHVEPGRAIACQPLTLGMRLSCAVISSGKAMLAENAAEERAEALGESLLEVIYSPDGHAEWVVFAGSPAMLARMDQMIAAAECGNQTAQADIALSYSLGANGLPFDREEAYRWGRLASRGGNVIDQELVKSVSSSLAEPRRQAIDQETDQWRPIRPCP